METVPEEIIEQTWTRIASLSQDDSETLAHKMTEQQPIVAVYLSAVGGDLLTEEEHEIMLYIGLVVWQIMNSGKSRLPMVTEAALEDAEDRNLKILESMQDESPGDFWVAIKNLIQNYNQIEVLKYVLEALMEEDEDFAVDDSVREEMKGMMLIYLKSVIDCFDQFE